MARVIKEYVTSAQCARPCTAGPFLWHLVRTETLSSVALISSDADVYLEWNDKAQIILLQPVAKVTFGRLVYVEGGIITAYIGQHNGFIHLIHIDESKNVTTLAQSLTVLKTPIDYLLLQPNNNRKNNFRYNLWVVSDNKLHMICGGALAGSSATSSNLDRVLSCCLEAAASFTCVLRVQVLEAVGDRRFSTVAVNLLSSAGSVQVYLLSGSAALCVAAKAFQQPNSVKNDDIFIPCAVTVSIPPPSPAALSERAVASVIEHRSIVRQIIPDYKMGDFLELPIKSVAVRIQGAMETFHTEIITWPPVDLSKPSPTVPVPVRPTYAQIVASQAPPVPARALPVFQPVPLPAPAPAPVNESTSTAPPQPEDNIAKVSAYQQHRLDTVLSGYSQEFLFGALKSAQTKRERKLAVLVSYNSNKEAFAQPVSPIKREKSVTFQL